MELIKALSKWMGGFGIVWLILWRKPAIWRNVTDWVERKKERTIYLFLFVFTLMSQGWLPFMQSLPLSADETYTMAAAAYFAGYDWSPYMHMKKFYNFGYTILLTPIYKLFEDPVAIYRAMLFCNIVVHAFMILVVYYVIRDHLKCTKCFSIAVTLAVSCNTLMLFFRGFMYNEIPLAMIVWLMLAITLKLMETGGRNRAFLSAVLGLVAAYAYIIHSRCVIVYAAFGIAVLCYLFVYRKLLVQPVTFSTVFAACIYIEMKLMDYVKLHLYHTQKGEVMQNSVEHVVTGTWRYRSLTSLHGLKILVSEFFTLSGATSMEIGGILTVVTVVVLYFVVKKFKSLRTGKEDHNLFFLLLFSTVSLWGMVAAVALTGASNEKPRFMAYTRYFVPFLGPFLMTGLVIMKRYCHLFKMRFIVFWCGVITLLVGGAYVFYAYPILYNCDMRMVTSYYFFLAFARYSWQLNFTKNVFISGLGLLTLFTIGILFLYKRKQVTAICMAVVIFSGTLFWATENRQCYPASGRRYRVTDAVCSLVKEDISNGRTVYCTGTDYYKKSLLVVCYDEDIVYDLFEVTPERDGMVVSNKREALELLQPKYIYKMDSNEWVGIWDKELKKVFDEKYDFLIVY